MSSRPFMKFYPSDWRAEPRLRMCSLAARGLWIDLMSYMHEGQPYGYLTINGAAPGIDDIAALVSRPIKEVQRAFEELEARQVFSVDEGSGAIYSRRMVRDHDRSEEGREQIKKRWGITTPNRGPNRGPTRSEANDLLLRSQKLDTRKKDIDPLTSFAGPSENPKVEFEKTKKGRKPSSKVPLPSDFEPELLPAEIPEFQRFKDSALAHDRRYANWGAAWRNWKSSPYNRGNGDGTSRQAGKPPSAITAAVDDLIRQFDRNEGGGGEVRQIAPRLLSNGRR